MNEGRQSVHSAPLREGVSNAAHTEAAEALDALLRELAQQRGVHHAVVHVEGGDGEFEWSGAIGEAAPGGRYTSAAA